MGIYTVKRPAVFLDRDGVLNQAIVRDGLPYPPNSVDELAVLPGVPEALDELRGAGFGLVVVTNQPDVARGTQSRAAVDAINATLARVLTLDDVRVCFHDDADQCVCRKPKPGLLLEEPLYDLPRSVMVGDRWKDIGAGHQAGVGYTVLVDHHYNERQPIEPDLRVASLAEAVPWILRFHARGQQ